MKVIDMAVHEVATITADKTICDCARQMRLEHVGSLVVVNDDQTPLGMITDRDIAIEVVARNLDPMKLTVRDVMTTPVVTAGPSESMVVALARMREFGVRRLPIVDEEGKLVGVISNSNLVEELSSLLDSLVRNIHSSKTREVALRSDERCSRGTSSKMIPVGSERCSEPFFFDPGCFTWNNPAWILQKSPSPSFSMTMFHVEHCPESRPQA